jgi:hypothetical protein
VLHASQLTHCRPHIFGVNFAAKLAESGLPVLRHFIVDARRERSSFFNATSSHQLILATQLVFDFWSNVVWIPILD